MSLLTLTINMIVTLVLTMISLCDQSVPSPYILRIVARGCAPGNHERSSTGFLVKDPSKDIMVPSIITSLHGVANCNTIDAISNSKPITNVQIVKIDIQHDIALLSITSEQAKMFPGEGLVAADQLPEPDTKGKFEDVCALGYPAGISKLWPYRQIRLHNNKIRLKKLIPPVGQLSTELAERQSPSLVINVIGIEGELARGVSGAPLFDSTNRVIGIIEGGLKEVDADTVSWAIPWADIQLEDIDEDIISHLEEHDPRLVFAVDSSSMSTPTPQPTATPIPPVTPRDATAPQAETPVKNELILLKPDGIESSSVDNKYYPPSAAFDKDPTTSWGLPNSKLIGSWLKVLFREPKTISRIGLYRQPGTTSQILEANLIFADGTSQQIKFGVFDEWNYVDIAPVVTNEITIELLSVSPKGTSPHIFELALWGNQANAAALPTNTPEQSQSTLLKPDGIESSSVDNRYYPPEAAFDKDPVTSWGIPNSKLSESWLKVLFREPKTISRIGLYRQPGTTPQIQKANLVFADGSSQAIKFDGFDEWNYVELESVTTNAVTIELVSVYPTGFGPHVFEIALFGGNKTLLVPPLTSGPPMAIVKSTTGATKVSLRQTINGKGIIDIPVGESVQVIKADSKCENYNIRYTLNTRPLDGWLPADNLEGLPNCTQ